jgi:hypothetical protein
VYSAVLVQHIGDALLRVFCLHTSGTSSLQYTPGSPHRKSSKGNKGKIECSNRWLRGSQRGRKDEQRRLPGRLFRRLKEKRRLFNNKGGPNSVKVR